MCCCILVCAYYWPRNGRNNVLIGLPDLVKERKISQIVIEDYQIFIIIFHVNFPYKTSISPASIAPANTVTRLSQQRMIVENISHSSDAQRRYAYGLFTSGDVQDEAWIFYVFVLSCDCYVFVRVCLYVLCGHLLGKG